MNKNFLNICAAAFVLLIMAGATSQIFKTTLRITVRNELGNIVEGAEVQLFKTEDDFENNTNPASEVQLTDAKGVVNFKNLEPVEYYVNVAKDEASNYGAGVQTGVLDEKKLNKVTIIIQ